MTGNGGIVQMPSAPTALLGQQPDGPSMREVMSRFATGVTVLTVGGEQVHGMTANAFTSVSLDPPLVLCCVANTAWMNAAIVSARSFGVSVLGADQEQVARHFADRRRPMGPAQFEGGEWVPGPETGAPVLPTALAWLECDLVQVRDGGDHSIFLGQVLNMHRGAGASALLFFGGGFQQIVPPQRTARSRQYSLVYQEGPW
jgi:flavin reductase (DIM6/NTAB) family NADH-FMN oxidoreductase RutF